MTSGAHVLLVVHDSTFRPELREALLRGGHRCITAERFDWSGRGLDPEEHPVDVVLLDLPYDDADSVLLDADMRRRFPTSGMLVLNLQGESSRTEPGDDSGRVHGRRVARMSKPFSTEALLDAMDWLLGHSADATERLSAGTLLG